MPCVECGQLFGPQEKKVIGPRQQNQSYCVMPFISFTNGGSARASVQLDGDGGKSNRRVLTPAPCRRKRHLRQRSRSRACGNTGFRDVQSPVGSE